ncbi:MAG: SDR family NAD(P)-dependent oxidoreductase [Erysipelotrichaceae bacterium]|nr:SDR family NAD(P)-dependent oxidoreductase [Erysipelotrichaceae bacterium]
MNMDTILITGATSGIGLALAKRYLADGNKVIIVGRNEEKLQNTVKDNPGLIPLLCDVSIEENRIKLFEIVSRDYPEVNILINNAGIQQRSLLCDLDWQDWKKELDTNLDAPIHLCNLFVPFLKGKDNATIINVTSGLAFRPMNNMPVYCATKAGLHSFTYILREQLRDMNISVLEIIPPAVNTNLGGPGVHSSATDVDIFTDSVYPKLLAGQEEIGFEFSQAFEGKTRRELETMQARRS